MGWDKVGKQAGTRGWDKVGKQAGTRAGTGVGNGKISCVDAGFWPKSAFFRRGTT
jgi:hypothetical protein